MLNRLLAAVLVTVASLTSAAAFDFRRSTTPGNLPPLTGPSRLGDAEVSINAADKRLIFKNVDGTLGYGSLLNAVPAGRRAVEQGQGDALTVGGTSLSTAIAPVVTLGISRADIATKIIPLNSFVVSGFAAVGDAGAGARYVAGASADYMAIQDAGGKWFKLDISSGIVPAAWVGVVAGDTSKQTVNGVAINGLMVALDAAVGRGLITLPAGNIYVDRTIDNRFNNMLVKGVGRRVVHDTGPTRDTAETNIIALQIMTDLLRHRTPLPAERGVTAAGNYKNSGGGFEDLSANANGVALRALHITSISHSSYRTYTEGASGTENVLFDCLIDYRVVAGQTQQMGEASDNQRMAIDMIVSQMGNNADGINFGGSLYNGNTSITTGIKIFVRVINGTAVKISNADNLVFQDVNVQMLGTTGMAVVVQAMGPGVSNGMIRIEHISANAPSKVETLADRPGSIALGDLSIGQLDGGNGTPPPTGPNVYVDTSGFPAFMSFGKSFNTLAIGDSIGTTYTAKQYLDAHPGTSMVINNGSSGGMVWMAGTHQYLQRIDGGSGNLQFLGLADAPLIEFAPPVKFYNGITTTSIVAPSIITDTVNNGVLVGAFIRPTDPTTANITAGKCADWNNTTAGTYKHVCNFGGTLRSVTMN